MVIAPSLFDTTRLRVDVETKSELGAGQTVCDIWKQSGKPANASVATRMHVDSFWDLMMDALSAADANADPRLREVSKTVPSE
eukprot:6059063-Pyramimonas_sp.AAC.1